MSGVNESHLLLCFVLVDVFCCCLFVLFYVVFFVLACWVCLVGWLVGGRGRLMVASPKRKPLSSVVFIEWSPVFLCFSVPFVIVKCQDCVFIASIMAMAGGCLAPTSVLLLGT